VHLPDGTPPFDVGSGAHEWTVPDPYAQPPVLAAEPTIREVMDHEPAWA